ncbi:MAG: tetratricopeptide repeat protein [Bacteroidota bacterium]|nr:tetratricopeptide repeat protein [Bacteroidota bacterium]
MKRYILISITLCLSLGTIQGATLNDSARQSYNNGNYAIAASLYEEMLKAQPRNAAIYYNLGNAYYKMDMHGSAILNYERAHRLNPTDEDIKHNLELTHSQVKGQVESMPELFFIAWLDKLNTFLSVRTWGTISIVLFLLFIGFTAWRLFRKKPGARAALSSIAIVSLVLSGICLGLAFRLDKQIHTPNEAIVFEDSLIKSSPSETGINLFEVNEGIKIEVLDSLNNYTQIRLPNGKKGWIRSRNIEHIRLYGENK